MSFESDPFSGFVTVTPSDSTNIAVPANTKVRGILVGGAGVVAALDSRGNVTNITASAGQLIPGLIVRVNSTNTTATGLVAGY